MCTRFVYRGDEVITGFNFDIDLDVWDHEIIKDKDCFFIGILRPDGVRHSYHGVNRNGNVGTLLYVHGNPEGAYQDDKDCTTIADLTEQFVQAKITFDDALQLLQNRKIVYAPDATMQALLSDQQGRTLIIEPGIGWREKRGRYALITNYSILAPESTRPGLNDSTGSGRTSAITRESSEYLTHVDEGCADPQPLNSSPMPKISHVICLARPQWWRENRVISTI